MDTWRGGEGRGLPSLHMLAHSVGFKYCEDKPKYGREVLGLPLDLLDCDRKQSGGDIAVAGLDPRLECSGYRRYLLCDLLLI